MQPQELPLQSACVLSCLQVALLLWMSAVVIIYGVSYMRLANLQAPLASLNAVAHVRFRVAR